MTEWQDNIAFILIANLIGDYICALLIEKGISILQNRTFKIRYVFGYFLLVLAMTIIFKGIIRSA